MSTNHLSHILPGSWACCEANPAGLISFPDGGDAMLACAPCLGTVPASRRLPLPAAPVVTPPSKPALQAGLYGTCAGCGATCTRVFLAERDAEEGFCADCIVNVL